MKRREEMFGQYHRKTKYYEIIRWGLFVWVVVGIVMLFSGQIRGV